jgi:pyruvyltransferase
MAQAPHTPAFWLTSHNYGDNLNHYILSRLAAGGVGFVSIELPVQKVVAIGTILNWCNEHCIAWGPGLGDRTHFMNPACEIRAVRGPLTAARARECGASVPDVFGDPALLMPLIYRPPARKTHALGIIPHYVDQWDVATRYAKESSEIRVIDILDTPERVTDAIAGCDRIISSSLHGIIVAHAYGIPAAWVRFSDRIGGDGMKYVDHFAAVGLSVEASIDLSDLPAVADLKRRCKKQFSLRPVFDPGPLLKAAPFPLAPGLHRPG